MLTVCVCLSTIRSMKPEPIYKQIGGIVRALRRRADKPQDALAGQLGISRATLANIETGRQRILVHQLYAIARALNVKLTDLLPPALANGSEPNWTDLSFKGDYEGDLNTEQKKQVANLIGQIDGQTSQLMEGTNAKVTRRNARGPSAKTAR
jgi:transcriptional regulator with XRE-family HTH domain